MTSSETIRELERSNAEARASYERSKAYYDAVHAELSRMVDVYVEKLTAPLSGFVAEMINSHE